MLLVEFLPCFTRETTFVTTCLPFYTTIPFWGVYCESKELAVKGTKFQKRGKIVLTELPSLREYLLQYKVINTHFFSSFFQLLRKMCLNCAVSYEKRIFVTSTDWKGPDHCAWSEPLKVFCSLMTLFSDPLLMTWLKPIFLWGFISIYGKKIWDIPSKIGCFCNYPKYWDIFSISGERMCTILVNRLED